MGKRNSIAPPHTCYMFLYVQTLRIHIYIYGTKHITVLFYALDVKISKIISFLALSPHNVEWHTRKI